RFWILAYRWFGGWQTSLLVVKPDTVLRWHRQGWRSIGAGVHASQGGQARRPIAPHHIQNAVRVLRDRSRQPASSPRARDAESHRLVGGSANYRMLCLGSQVATISRS